MRYLEHRLYSCRVLYRRRTLPNPRQPRAPGHDGSRMWDEVRQGNRARCLQAGAGSIKESSHGVSTSQQPLCVPLTEQPKLLQELEAGLSQQRHTKGLTQVREGYEKATGTTSLEHNTLSSNRPLTLTQDIIPQQPQGYPNEFNKQFLDLLKKIFVYNPAKRITAKQALKHPWFKQTLEDDGTEALKIRKNKEEKARQESERRRSSGTYAR